MVLVHRRRMMREPLHRQAVRRHCPDHAVEPVHREGVVGIAVDEGKPGMAELQQKPRGIVKRTLIVDVEE